MKRNKKYKERYDLQAKDLSNIEPGTTVRIRTNKQNDWSAKGIVMSRCSEPRSYSVKNSKGNMVRRNRRHLLPTEEKYEEQINYDELQCSETEVNEESTIGYNVEESVEDSSSKSPTIEQCSSRRF